MSSEDTSSNWSVGQYQQQLSQAAVQLPAYYQAHVQYTQEADHTLQAFVSLDAPAIAEQAQQLQYQKSSGDAVGALFGVPIAVKDIIATLDFPTACGSALYSGRYADLDATVVHRLRQQGAIIYGKTVTTEFATFHPGPTRNPHDLDRSPGGSSSGSAAAVAAGLVPVALGSQTNGSVIRPASYCGVYGFKPSFGELPRTGVWEQSPSLDQLGLFARSIEDLARVGEIMAGDDQQDRASRGRGLRHWHRQAMSHPAQTPKFGFMRTPWWDQMDAEAQQACTAFVNTLPGMVEWVDMPSGFERVVGWHSQVNEAELANALTFEYLHHKEALSSSLQSRIHKAHSISAQDYLFAKSRIPYVNTAFDAFFEQYSAILTPAALGAAPMGLASTGNPIMQTLWTFAGLPTVSLPLLMVQEGLPLGIQAIGGYLRDGPLLQACRCLAEAYHAQMS